MSEYINKNELLKAMNTYDKFACTSAGCLERLTNSDDFVPYVKYDDMVKCVNNMLTADVVEVKRGLWLSIQQGDQGYSAGDFICSCCGKPNKCYSITDYCANCGAKMERAKSK